MAPRFILAIGLAIKAAQSGHRIAFATAVDRVARLKAAHSAARLTAELTKLRRIGLIVVDEAGEDRASVIRRGGRTRRFRQEKAVWFPG